MKKISRRKTFCKININKQKKTMSYRNLVESLDPSRILKEFDVVPIEQTSGAPTSAGSADSSEEVFIGADEEQVRLMEELCIVVDYKDEPIAAATKKVCHLNENINKGLLHRAFSVFLFDEEDKLLLQQRADGKITFSNMWTNTCCSHPLAVPTEINGVEGATNAARRKLDHELGIPIDNIPFDAFKFVKRIHYMAPSGGPWGEHEVDYIFVVKCQRDKLTLFPNANEVGDVRWVSSKELRSMMEDTSLVFTPWFKLICESYLFKWWDDLDSVSQHRSDTIDCLL